MLVEEMPTEFRSVSLDVAGLKAYLMSAAPQDLAAAPQTTISLPSPSGKFEEYVIKQNSVVAPEVAQYYTIKTFEGYAVGNPGRVIRCDISEAGFHAMVYDGDRTFVIEPVSKSQARLHISYFRKDVTREKTKCGVIDEAQLRHKTEFQQKITAPASLRTFKLAAAASGEYSIQFGGSPINKTTVLNSLASGREPDHPYFLRETSE